MKLTITLLGFLPVVLGCASPEASRTRGGGPGADGGNRGEVVEMHAGAEPYHRTPQLIGARGGQKQSEPRQDNRR